MINAIVIYYSLEGNTEFIANIISQEIEYKSIKINPLISLDPKTFSKYIIGGMEAKLKIKPKIKKIEIDFNEYDLIIIGTPVWGGTFASPIRTFITENNITEKYIGIFSCGMTKKNKAIYDIEKILNKKNNKCIGKISFESVLKNKDKSKIIAEAWANEIFNKLKLDKETKNKI